MDTLLRTLALLCVALAAVNACLRDEFRCKRRAYEDCLPQVLVCNGVNDCADNSDESQCGSPRTCPERYFECPNGRCIPSRWVCDGTPDCDHVDPDAADERNCVYPPYYCESNDFKCNSTRRKAGCIPRRWVCDGDHGDCIDDSDEQNCPSTPAPAAQRNVHDCGETMMWCKTWFGSDCIHLSSVCNGIFDCADHSDESQCGSPRTCPDRYFACPNGSCIPWEWRCDGANSCRDADGGSDERGCIFPPYRCTENYFVCQTTRRHMDCIPKSWVCDGDHGDCLDDSDEQNCGPSSNTTTSTPAPVTAGIGSK